MAIQRYVPCSSYKSHVLILCLGMAMRLAFDLALHVDMAPHVAKGTLTSQEAELRRDVFWSAYTIDQ